MYRLTDQQIDHILNDISARGVKMESLQHNLLDHICCIIERDLEPNGDFEQCYAATIKKFYKNELSEIEAETVNLLTFKNYYVMKKILIVSGIASVVFFLTGSVFKIMHWPGASFFLILGTIFISLLFFPLLFILRNKEAKTTVDKVLAGSGALVGILFCMAVLFAIMHLPGARSGVLWFASIGIAIFVFIPTYFFTGIRNPETKTNTILTSIILVGVACLQFTMVNLRPVAQGQLKMFNYVQSEGLLKKMQQHQLQDSSNTMNAQLANDINTNCEKLKNIILQNAAPGPEQKADLKEMALNDNNLGNDFYDQRRGNTLLAYLRSQVEDYNKQVSDEHKIPVENTVLTLDQKMLGSYSNLLMLNGITQIQLYLANAGSVTTAANTGAKKKEG